MKRLAIVAISIILLAASFSLGYSFQVSAQESFIPSWIKKTAQWWAQNQTSDTEFLQAIQYLIDNHVLHGASVISSNNNASYASIQNTQLQKLNDLQARYDTLQTKYNLLLQKVKNTSTQLLSQNENTASIFAVAVKPVIETDGFFETTTYQGSILKITVEIRDGSGLVLVNTAIPAGVDFQSSARTAAMVAQNYTGMDLSKKDVIFSINPVNDQDLQAVDGPSAGGAMTVLLISDLLGKPINGHVLMTGTIQSDGTIGPIGAASDKADAAGQYGAKTFLVPKGESVVQVQNCTERNEGPILYQTCTTEPKSLSPIMQDKYDMQVIEIGTIEDALKYFNST